MAAERGGALHAPPSAPLLGAEARAWPDASEVAGESPGAGGVLQRSSSRLLRAASATFTGGATVLPPPAEREAGAPQREATASRRSLRRASTVAVEQRMLEEVWNRYRIRISLLTVLLVVFSMMMVLLFAGALWATLAFRDLPCDQPLNQYFCVSVLVGQLAPSYVKRVLREPWVRRSPRRILLVSMCGSLPGWSVMAWGFWMVNNSQDCQETNPNLYYPMKHFIYGQVVLFVLTTLFFSVGFRGVLAFASSLPRDRPGCRRAVLALPQVPGDSPELRDAQDDSALECPICTEAFGVEQPTVVRTLCGHLFHQHCLAKWCSSHLDCPMCRAVVGEEDKPPLRSGGPVAEAPRAPGGGATAPGPPAPGPPPDEAV